MTVTASVMTAVRLLGGMGLCPGYFFCSSCVRLSFGMAFLLLVLICAFTPDSLQETSTDKKRRCRLGHDLTGCEVFDACFCRLDTAATVFSQPGLDPVLPIGIHRPVVAYMDVDGERRKPHLVENVGHCVIQDCRLDATVRHAMIPIERRIQQELSCAGSIPYVETEMETGRIVRRTDETVVDARFHTLSDRKGPAEAGPMTVLMTLVVLRIDLIEALRMLARGALGRWLGPLIHIPAFAADPDDLVILLEDGQCLDFLEQLAVPFLMMGFSYRNGTQAASDCLVAFLISDVGKARIHRGRLIVFTVDGRLQVLGRCPQHQWNFHVYKLQFAAVLLLDVLEKMKQDAGMLPFLISGLGEDPCYLLEPFGPGHLVVHSVPVTSHGFTYKSCTKIEKCLFQRSPPCASCVATLHCIQSALTLQGRIFTVPVGFDRLAKAGNDTVSGHVNIHQGWDLGECRHGLHRSTQWIEETRTGRGTNVANWE